MSAADSAANADIASAAPNYPDQSKLSLDGIRRNFPYLFWGAHASPENTTFRVFAPNATNVKLLCSKRNWNPDQMNRLEDGTWEITVSGDPLFAEYKYDIENNRTNYHMGRIDPFSPRLVWTEFNGARNFNSIVGDSKPYPW
jgi:1,4-alpha-glucan branching enzyme